MKNNWRDCKNILCIRPDNMGDLIMTGPALRALKETFGSKITVLTSSMAAGIAKLMPMIDEVIIFDVPWVKNNSSPYPEVFNDTVKVIGGKKFDAAIIFTVYSQNPLPAVMLPYLAGIPRRLAYCRENPYQLLTDWMPDQEPYSVIKHQVRRDLDLVEAIGAVTNDDQLELKIHAGLKDDIIQTITGKGINLDKPWLIFHPGVSEIKREYPAELWVAAGQELINQEYQIIITGAPADVQLCTKIQMELGEKSINTAGLFSLEEFVTLISMAPVIVSVNTGTVHISAAVGTPVVVLYALTNPQHTPWKVPNKVLYFPIPISAQSRNEVIRHISKFIYAEPVNMPNGGEVARAVHQLLHNNVDDINSGPAIIGLPHHTLCQNQVFPAN